MAEFLKRNYRTIMVGLGATFIADCWTFFLNEFGIKSQFIPFLGRWIGNFPKGKFIHHTIVNTAPVKNEILIGWLAHYCTGVIFGFLFIYLFSKKWLDTPKLTPAFLFGFLTLILPLLIFVPAIGFCNPLLNLPEAKLPLLRTLAYHAVFVIGLYLSAKALLRFSTLFLHHNNTTKQ